MPAVLRLPMLRRRATDALARWPNHCAICHADTRGPLGRICGDCLSRHAAPRPRCTRCAIGVPLGVAVCGRCLRDPPPWSRSVAACDYGYPWDGLLGALKFRDGLDLVPALAGLLADRIVPISGATVDVVLPVPLADARLRERGYNQAALLAEALAQTLNLRFEPRWLRRLIDTPHQLALPRDRRTANVRGAFAVEPVAAAALAGLRLALVDDVMTTGATLGEAARALLAAGAAEVQTWVVARTPE